MLKGFAVTGVLVLLLSCAASAQLLNYQDFVMEPFNSAYTLGGDGGAASTNSMVTEGSQLADDKCAHVTLYQGEAAAVVQGAGAVGSCGVLGVNQYPEAQGPDLYNSGPPKGMQTQLHTGGCAGDFIQPPQQLYFGLGQDVTNLGGVGSALGIQQAVGIQTQLAFNLWGGTANVQGLGVTLFDGIVAQAPGAGTLISDQASVGVQN
jgi:hypothetical protein